MVGIGKDPDPPAPEESLNLETQAETSNPSLPPSVESAQQSEVSDAPHEETPVQEVTGENPEPPAGKTYTPLSEARFKDGRKVPIVMCSAVLENHLQCWRSGDFYVDGPGVKVPYQLCRFHANQMQVKEQQEAAAAKAEPTPETTDSEPAKIVNAPSAPPPVS